MNAVALQSFGFGEQLVRVVDRSGAIWFVANDVCAALEISNASDAVARLEQDERSGVGITDPHGREQETTIISESGLYALIFRSRKPVAVQFRTWVTGEVLPAIRRTGRYFAPANDAGPWLEPPPKRSQEDLEAVRVSIELVKLAQRLRGSEAAIRLWKAEGLPDVLEDRETLALQAEAWGVTPSVREWIGARIERLANARARSMDLYNDFIAWCGDSGFEPLGVRGFAGQLDLLGIEARKSNGMWRLGIRLRD